MIAHQTLPTEWQAREALREKGQFWTPGWVAEAMVGYVTAGGAGEVFDPAVGSGAFFQAARSIEGETGRRLHLSGTEIDPAALRQGLAAGLTPGDIEEVALRDFLSFHPARPLPAVVANPPYIRHHRLSAETKGQLRRLSLEVLGFALDGRAGYHVYFLIHALRHLAEAGRLAFILPADTCEGVFADKLLRWITRHFCLDAVVTFEPAASPFPRVDTNAVVLCIRRAAPRPACWWTRVREPWTDDLKRWLRADFDPRSAGALDVGSRALDEALRTGLSRQPESAAFTGATLGDYAAVVRGIATGANEFFFLTRAQCEATGMPAACFLPAVGRTRDVETEVITEDILGELDARGRPTLLLSLGSAPEETFGAPVRRYLAVGKAAGLPGKALIKQRRPWYKMEVRKVPPLLFAYLGRRRARFIRNQAGVVPLTGFLCVYPRHDDAGFVERLWTVLRHPDTVGNLGKVGKSYGSGAIKVEPRALERLPLPGHVVEAAGLAATRLPI